MEDIFSCPYASDDNVVEREKVTDVGKRKEMRCFYKKVTGNRICTHIEGLILEMRLVPSLNYEERQRMWVQMGW